jgi:hypothetical protein
MMRLIHIYRVYALIYSHNLITARVKNVYKHKTVTSVAQLLVHFSAGKFSKKLIEIKVN